MEKKRLALIWNIRVVTRDGRSGKLRGVVMVRRANRISHIIVRRGLRKTVTLPLDRATQQADGTLVLQSSPQKGAKAAEPGKGSIRYSSKSVVRFGQATALPLQGLLLDGPSGAVASLLAGASRYPKVITMDKVRNLHTGSPSAQDEMEDYPSYRPDNEARVLAERALRNADPTGGDTYGAVRLEVREGIAYLSGNVRLPIQMAEAEEATRGAYGVLDVENGIATDWDIQLAVAEAMAQARLTRSGTVLVKSSLGRVTLRGNLASAEQIQQAIDLTGATAGVRAAVSEVEIVEPAPVEEEPPEEEAPD